MVRCEVARRYSTRWRKTWPTAFAADSGSGTGTGNAHSAHSLPLCLAMERNSRNITLSYLTSKLKRAMNTLYSSAEVVPFLAYCRRRLVAAKSILRVFVVVTFICSFSFGMMRVGAKDQAITGQDGELFAGQDDFVPFMLRQRDVMLPIQPIVA